MRPRKERAEVEGRVVYDKDNETIANIADSQYVGARILAAAPKILPQMMQTLSPHMKKAQQSAKPGVSREA